VAGLLAPLAWHRRAKLQVSVYGKNISHGGAGFSHPALGRHLAVGNQRPGKLQSYEMVIIQVRHPNGLGADDAGSIREPLQRPDGSAGNFKRKGGRSWQRMPRCDQRAPGGNVDCGGKLQQIPVVFVVSPDENRNRQV